MPVVASPEDPAQSLAAKTNVTPMFLDTPVKTSPVVSTTAQSSRIITDTPTVALPKLDVAMPGGTTTLNPVSTAAAPEIPTAAA